MEMKAKREWFVQGGIGILVLADGNVTYVDLEDLQTLKEFNWFAHGRYVARRSGKKRRLLHHDILQPTNGLVVDHINRNPRDNRRCNLRLVTPSVSNANRATKSPASGFRGVRRVGQRWAARVGGGKKRLFLGTFATAREAALAYNAAAIELFGPDTPINLLGPPPVWVLRRIDGRVVFVRQPQEPRR
jgi:hypothetical protein